MLSRGPVDPATGKERGVVVEPSLLPPYPTIERVVPPDEQPAARLGETVRLAGHHLDGTSAVARFAHRLLDEPNEVTIGASTDSTGIDVALPSGAAAEQDWPAGVYTVTVSLIRPGEPNPRDVERRRDAARARARRCRRRRSSRDAARGASPSRSTSRPQVRPAQEAQLDARRRQRARRAARGADRRR